MTATLSTLAQFKPNPNWARLPLFNCKTWSRVRFGDVIESVNEVIRKRTQSFLTDDHIERVIQAYEQFKDEPGLAHVVTLEKIRANNGNLSIPPLRGAASEWWVGCQSDGGGQTGPDVGSQWLAEKFARSA